MRSVGISRRSSAAERSAVQGVVALIMQGNGSLKARLLLIHAAIATINLFAWSSALLAFSDKLSVLGIAALVYGLGLRHAVDADHIAAIDNVTRKLMQQNKRPVSVGFWFAVGHSAVVIFVTAAVVGATSLLGRFRTLGELGGVISTSCSAIFLFAIAGINLLICSINAAFSRASFVPCSA